MTFVSSKFLQWVNPKIPQTTFDKRVVDFLVFSPTPFLYKYILKIMVSMVTGKGKNFQIIT